MNKKVILRECVCLSGHRFWRCMHVVSFTALLLASSVDYAGETRDFPLDLPWSKELFNNLLKSESYYEYPDDVSEILDMAECGDGSFSYECMLNNNRDDVLDSAFVKFDGALSLLLSSIYFSVRTPCLIGHNQANNFLFLLIETLLIKKVSSQLFEKMGNPISALLKWYFDIEKEDEARRVTQLGWMVLGGVSLVLYGDEGTHGYQKWRWVTTRRILDNTKGLQKKTMSLDEAYQLCLEGKECAVLDASFSEGGSESFSICRNKDGSGTIRLAGHERLAKGIRTSVLTLIPVLDFLSEYGVKEIKVGTY